MKVRHALAIGAGACGLATACVGATFFRKRFETMVSIKQLTDHDSPFNLYYMDVHYKYDLDRMIRRGLAGETENQNSILAEALPLLPVKIQAPDFGCSAFTINNGEDGLMGRNYDFKFDTSAMIVHCTPKNGYESIGICALDNLSVTNPLDPKGRLASLAAPFTVLDGLNEMGVSIAVLTLDSKPTRRHTGKPALSTPLAIRLVLDRAATTQEAVDLLSHYDMYATNGRDYHFYITDATGDGRVVEYDCDSPERTPVVTPSRQVTNFFVMHQEKVAPNQKNGHYGHGRERFDAIEEVLDDAPANEAAHETAWRALRAASQEPNPEDITSNTQWSIVFDNKNLTADIALRRRWDDVHHADIHGAVN